MTAYRLATRAAPALALPALLAAVVELLRHATAVGLAIALTYLAVLAVFAVAFCGRARDEADWMR